VKENPETSKPYIDYVVEVVKGNSHRWKITRKYKEFCELHQDLVTSHPGFKFPKSTGQILGFNVDYTSLLQSRKPTVIEDRRRDLQQYVRDLLKMPKIYNSPLIRTFLKIDEHYDEYGIKINKFRNSNQTDGAESVGDAPRQEKRPSRSKKPEPNYQQRYQNMVDQSPDYFNSNFVPNTPQNWDRKGQPYRRHTEDQERERDSLTPNNHKDPAESFNSQSSYGNYSKNNCGDLNKSVERSYQNINGSQSNKNFLNEADPQSNERGHQSNERGHQSNERGHQNNERGNQNNERGHHTNQDRRNKENLFSSPLVSEKFQRNHGGNNNKDNSHGPKDSDRGSGGGNGNGTFSNY
jgi:hypothetical protein